MILAPRSSGVVADQGRSRSPVGSALLAALRSASVAKGVLVAARNELFEPRRDARGELA
jgi:hypothetical protein